MRSTPVDAFEEGDEAHEGDGAGEATGDAPRRRGLAKRAAEKVSASLPWAVAVLLALAVLALAVVGGDEGRRRVDDYAKGRGGHRYVATDAGFRAEFPTMPERRVHRVVVDGAKVPVVDYTSGAADSQFTVSFAEIPADQDIGNPILRLNANAVGAAEAVKGKLVSSTITTLAGLPAVEYVVSVDGRFLRATSLISGRRLYGVQVVGRTNPPRGYERFRSSFEVAT